MLILTFSTVLVNAQSNANEVYIVVNANTDVDELNRSEIINIFMGRSNFIGQQSHSAMPLDIRGHHEAKEIFYKILIKRSLSEVQSYWARLIFSGDATPPKQIETYTEIRKTLRDNHGAIAYLPASEYQSELHNDLKVVYVIKDH